MADSRHAVHFSGMQMSLNEYAVHIYISVLVRAVNQNQHYYQFRRSILL